MARPRLSREKWIAAGLHALAATGPDALAAEPLARTLKTTKGSFYWHFKDVPAFQEAVLTAWRTIALQEVVSHVQHTGDPDAKLRSFGRSILGSDIEPKLRIWALNNGSVAQAVAEVDTERLQLLTRLLGSLGLSNPDFARALLATLTGLPLTADAANIAPYDTLIDTVLALQ